jgi:F0F1-type ATP synthase assembly protein I
MTRRNEDRNRNQSPKPDDSLLQRYARAFQENVTRAGPVAAGSYALIGAILLFGAIGYAIDLWSGASPWFLLGGLVLGLIVGFYELAKAVWPR